MRIQSNYYDIIDFLQNFDDDRIFLRKESTVVSKVVDWKCDKEQYLFQKIDDKRPMSYQINVEFERLLHNHHNKEKIENLKKFGHPADFYFLPTNLKIPINVYLNSNPENIVIKESTKKQTSEIVGYEQNFFKQFNQFVDETYKSLTWKCSIKPICCIIMTNWDGTARGYNGLVKNVIWINPPLVTIPNLLSCFGNSYQQIYQEIEQYLWGDVNNDANISNDVKIVSHGFDIKKSFRK